MPSPFFIDPSMGSNPNALPGLSQALLGYGAAQKQEQAEEKLSETTRQAQAVFKSRDADAIAEFTLANPQFAGAMKNSMGIRSQQQESEAKDFARNVLTSPGRSDQLYQDRIQQLQAQGRDATNTIQSYEDWKANPEDEARDLEVVLAGLSSKQEWDAYKGAKISGKEAAETGKLEAETRLLEQKFKKLGSDETPTEDKVKIEKDLRQEVFGRSKDFEKVDDAWGRVKISAENPTPAGDMAMIFNYMKMLDPGSTVREGEFATAQQAGSVPDRVTNIYNRVREGTRLTPSQRKDFVTLAKALFGEAKKKQDKLTGQYKTLAKQYGVSPENVILGDGSAIRWGDLE